MLLVYLIVVSSPIEAWSTRTFVERIAVVSALVIRPASDWTVSMVSHFGSLLLLLLLDCLYPKPRIVVVVDA